MTKVLGMKMNLYHKKKVRIRFGIGYGNERNDTILGISQGWHYCYSNVQPCRHMVELFSTVLYYVKVILALAIGVAFTESCFCILYIFDTNLTVQHFKAWW